MTPEIARKRVARGAALLDEKRPGWFMRVDTETLQIEDCEACVLGQLGVDEFGYHIGRFSMMCERFFPATSDGPRTHGFGIDDAIDGEGSFDALTEAWLEAIAARRSETDAPVVVWTPREHIEA